MAEKPKSPQDDLEALFAAARAEAAAPAPAGLLARIEADAMAHLPPPRSATVTVAAARAPSGCGAILAALGGWPAMGGFATVALAGFWIGFAAPSGLVETGLALATGDAEAYGLVLPDYLLSDPDEG